MACKGICFLPKRACNVMKCETAIALKLTTNTVEPLKFVVPRKSEAFQVRAARDPLRQEQGLSGSDSSVSHEHV